MMTDIWCFTCGHELRRLFPDGYAHADSDDKARCTCIEDGEACQP